MDRGPRTGVTGAVSLSDLDFIKGGGASNGQALRLGSTVYLIGWRIWSLITLLENAPVTALVCLHLHCKG